ncbi:MAG: tRNA lysidine(34) synthetase TilS [Thermoguttaceae bacterium]|nr:tRNA lysidine(34) synthetase TilS [Thermoguttaceae bacterium]
MTLSDFENALLDSFPLEQWTKRRVCLATSGGADSVAALCAFSRIAERASVSKNLFVVTVDHRSRGAESDGDVLFVRELSARLHLEFFDRQIDKDELQKESKRQGSWESAARLLRYRLLFETARQNGARFLVTAHHNDDQLETLLFRIFRGSGLDGLRGIAPYRTVDESLTIVRPLLGLNRADILEYLNGLRQPYRTDSSNASPIYARNRIRNELIPLLETLFPGKWQNSLLRLAQIANDTESFFEKRVLELEQEIALAQKKEYAYNETLNKLHAAATQNENESSDAVDFPRRPLQNVSEEIAVRYF